MTKDPAFLFYPGDWIHGTTTFSRLHKGAYMDLLMAQHGNGHLSIEDIKIVLGSDYDLTWESKLKAKFTVDENGLYFNRRLEEVMLKRKAFSDSRKKNLDSKKPHKGDQVGDLMENENRNGIKREEIKTWQDLVKFARNNHDLDFNKEKWKFEMPQCGRTASDEKREHHEKWNPIIKELNKILNNLK